MMKAVLLQILHSNIILRHQNLQYHSMESHGSQESVEVLVWVQLQGLDIIVNSNKKVLPVARNSRLEHMLFPVKNYFFILIPMQYSLATYFPRIILVAGNIYGLSKDSRSYECQKMLKSCQLMKELVLNIILAYL